MYRSSAQLAAGRCCNTLTLTLERRDACYFVAANYAEARAVQSRRDFVHKMQVCLKELRETRVWLELLVRMGGSEGAALPAEECDELTAIVVSSMRRRSAQLNGHDV